MKLLPLLVSLLLGDTVVTPPPCNSSGVCSSTLTAPDFCTNGGTCLSDAGAGGGGGGGISNPYLGTFIADAGVFNSLCLVDGGCIAQFPGQVLTGWDGGALGSLGLNFHCEAGRLTKTGAGTVSVNLVTPFQTYYDFCQCESFFLLSVACAASTNDGGKVSIINTGAGVNAFDWFCCGL